MKFAYRAVKRDGGEEAGEREAADRFALARELQAVGLTPVRVDPVGPAAGATRPHFNLKLNRLFGRVKTKDKIVFAGSLGAMISAGLSLARALSVIERQTSHKRFKQILAALGEKINRGESLSQSLAAFPDVFPAVFVAMVAAGEESGNLPQSLEIIRSQMEKGYDLRRKVKGAMIYPAVIVTVIIIIGILMMIFLVPNITSIFRELNVDLPLSTRVVIFISDFLATHTLLFVGAVLVAIMLFIGLVRTPRGHRLVVRLFMKTPVISAIIKNLNAAVTMRTISSLIAAGVSMVQTLQITTKVVQNPFYQAVLAEAEAAVQKGSTLSALFRRHEDIYPILVGEMAEVGEETGNLAGMLQKGAIFFEEEVEQTTKNLSTLIEPALMVLIGIAVGLFAVSMLGPMYSLSDKI